MIVNFEYEKCGSLLTVFSAIVDGRNKYRNYFESLPGDVKKRIAARLSLFINNLGFQDSNITLVKKLQGFKNLWEL
ncbi:MAG: hypothetical protein EHM44_07945, partial [Ignavibacteriales bacterium]